MLWYKLLQNTISCGTLQFTSYRLYENASWCGFKNCGQDAGGKRQKRKSLDLCSLHSLTAAGVSILNNLQQAHKRGGG